MVRAYIDTRMVKLPPIPSSIRGLPGRLAKAANLTELAKGSTVRLAVTGLSRAGKTVFITSLIHNLFSAAHNPHRMPLLRVVGDGRLIGATPEGAGAHILPRFPYQTNIERMTATPPDWPERTDDVSEIELDIRFAPAGVVGRALGRLSGGAATVRLKLVDYPGEWLLDLPLLEQSFAVWSRTMLRLYRKGIRAEIARDFLSFLELHRHDEPASEETAKQAHELYRTFLIAARDQYGLNYLQPGRFLRRGAIVDAPYFWFCPLDLPEGTDKPVSGSLGALMQQRFEVYKKEAVEGFYEKHFRHYTRQIVLVDVLRALLAGAEAFEDTRLAIQSIMESFRYGQGSILSKVLGSARIEKVLFAATKADHVPEMQRDNLRELLRHMAAIPSLQVKTNSAFAEVGALASVICTQEGTELIGGQTVQVVIGKPLGSDKQVKFFVGNVPIRPPRAEAWATRFLDVPIFEPPSIDVSPTEGIAHINLDMALEFLLGDRLR